MAFDKRRDEQRANAPDTPRHRGRKDRKRWCGGHEGREHIPGPPEPNHNYNWRHLFGSDLCHPRPGWSKGLYAWKDPDWWCNHYIRCIRCTKILNENLGATECPDYPGRGRS